MDYTELIRTGSYKRNKKDLGNNTKYHVDILYYQTTLNNITNITAKQKSSADSLIKLIRREYNITE